MAAGARTDEVNADDCRSLARSSVCGRGWGLGARGWRGWRGLDWTGASVCFFALLVVAVVTVRMVILVSLTSNIFLLWPSGPPDAMQSQSRADVCECGVGDRVRACVCVRPLPACVRASKRGQTEAA